jgi:AcrR family transcriptional regulator
MKLETESVSAKIVSGECLRLQAPFVGRKDGLGMVRKKTQNVGKKPRADAQRNRERILEVAKLAFTRTGADISLDDVAKQSGVGPGTLYRHFPTRGALLEAVYRSEVARLAAAQQDFSRTMAPVDAMRAWMLLFVDYIATKQIIAPALNTLIEGPSKLFECSGTLITEAIHSLVKRGIESGDIRPDLDPLDLLRALVGVSNVSSVPDWPASAKRLVQILIAGSRPTA